MTRIFTIQEANALIPRLTAGFGRTTQLIARARTLARRLAEAGISGSPLGDLPEEEAVMHDPDLAADLAQARLLTETAVEEAQRLEALGVVIRDLERGLVDFRSVMDGEREVFLCWHLGEREVRHWHDVHSGFVDRESIVGHQFFRSRQLRPPPE